MAIIIKSDREIALIKEAGKIIIELFDILKDNTLPSKSTYELDILANNFIKSKGAIASCYNYEGFPGHICISVNDTLIHGIPSKKIILKEGDIVSYDILVTKNGSTADDARTCPVGNIGEEAQKLIEVTEESFFMGVKEVRPGAHIGDISNAIETYVKSHGYSINEMFAGHGVGREVHEDPYVENTGHAHTGPLIKKGMTLAIEPMVNMGKKDVKILDDGWTCKTVDGKLCSHYENTVVVTSDGYEIITLKEGDSRH